jgi:hypothetical protein
LGTSGLRVNAPWEDAVREVVAQLPCVPAGERGEHESVELPYELDPKTNYLLDIVRQPRGGGDEVVVFRREFTTSRFRTLTAFAETIRDTIPSHRSVPFATPLVELDEHPTGAQLDQAFAAAGLDALGVPRYPLCTVLWSVDPVPQPVAVVIDANEPLWRSRLAPQRLPDGSNPQDPTAVSWQLTDVEWLTVVTAGSSSVRTVVRGPGYQRAVIVLQPNQRGRHLDVSLQRANDPVSNTGAATAAIASFDFIRAPWEDEG